MEFTLEIVCPAWYPGVDSLIEAIPQLADQGVTAIEIGINHPEYFDTSDGAGLQRLITKLSYAGVRVHSIHAPFGHEYDISSPDDTVHERGVESLIQSIELANLLGADKVIIHGSEKFTEGKSRRIDRARGVLRELSIIAKESGVIIALENLPPDYLGNTPQEILELLDGTDFESIRVCFDSGHANLTGHFMEYAEALLPFAITTHLHDNDGTGDQHRFPGDGNIDWCEFAATYRRCGCEAAIMLECKPPVDVPWSEAFQRFRAALGE